MNKQIFLLLLTLVFSIGSCTNKSEKLEIAIREYFIKSNTDTGGGNTKITAVEILEIKNSWATAYVQGYYSNHSLPEPETGNISDTLDFKFEKSDGSYRIISIKTH